MAESWIWTLIQQGRRGVGEGGGGRLAPVVVVDGVGEWQRAGTSIRL